MTITVRRSPIYALVAKGAVVSVRNAPVYALIKGKDSLPRNTPSPDAVAKAIKRTVGQEYGEGMDFVLGEPLVSSERASANTSIRVTCFSNTHEGSKVLYYSRRPIADLFFEVESTKLVVGEISSTHDLLDVLFTKTKIVLGEADILDSPIDPEATEITLVAGDKSYWFIPGSTVTVEIERA